MTKIGKLLQSVPLLFLEDVYTTGLCAEECGMARWHHRGFANPAIKDLKLKVRSISQKKKISPGL